MDGGPKNLGAPLRIRPAELRCCVLNGCRKMNGLSSQTVRRKVYDRRLRRFLPDRQTVACLRVSDNSIPG